MTQSIPASAFVAVTPSVLSAGGTALSLNGLMLTTSIRPPIGEVLQFANASDVADFFGGSSDEAAASTTYFNGFDNSSVKPGNLLFAQYPLDAVAAYIRSGSFDSVTLAQLQAITGTLAIAMDGYAWPATSFNLSAATSFSNGAAILQTALQASAPTAASVTATMNATTLLDVTAVGSGTLAPGQTVTGTNLAAGTTIIAQTTGTTGGIGHYTLSQAATGSGSGITVTAKATVYTVTFDSVSNAFVFTSGITGDISTVAFATGNQNTAMKLTSATGATLSQGSDAAVPGTFMTTITEQVQNWASFETLFDPDEGSGNAQKLLFAEWNNDQNNRYVYVCWDTDITPTESSSATGSLGYLLAQSNISGTCLIYEPSNLGISDFVCGAIASLNFEQLNGRASFAYRRQSGLTPSVTNQTIMNNLISNGYNFYASVATANDNFEYFYPGSVSGNFEWLDSYVNEIWITNAFQLALIELLLNALSIPYNSQGYSLIEAALADPIIAGVNFGAIRAGVPLSAAQKAEVNTAAGVTIDGVLSTRGWYLQIRDATAQVRAARGSPPCTFWYMDGQSVQRINLQSVVLQ